MKKVLIIVGVAAVIAFPVALNGQEGASLVPCAFAPCSIVDALLKGACESEVKAQVADYLKKCSSVDAICKDHVGKNDWTLLMLAVKEQYPEVAVQLLDAGANPDLQDAQGWTALMMAASNCQNKIMTKLLEKGANPSLKNKDGKTAYEIAKIKNAMFCQIPVNRESEKACAYKNMIDALCKYQDCKE